MNTKHISLAFAAAAALLAGCAKSSFEEPIDGQFADLELSYVGATETKAAIDGTTFPTDGEIGLFLFEDEQAAKAYGTGYENVKYSYNSAKSKWTASPSIKVGSTPGYLYGYYPYSSTAADIKAIPVSSSLNGDDVMYASKQSSPITDKTASQTTITMNHALARVAITVKNNGYTGDAKLSQIKFEGAKIAGSGTLDATSGSITATKADDVTLSVPESAQTITKEGTVFECLLVPSGEDESKQTVTLTLTIDGEPKTAILSGNDNGVIISRNTKSNITIGLSNSGISVASVSIDDWKEVEVGGKKVKVKFDEGVPGINKDILLMAYEQDGDVIIKSFSNSGKTVTCQLDDDTMVESVPDGNLSVFTLSGVSKDIVATIGVWGEGGRNQITVGDYKVTVELAEGVTESDVWFNAYVNPDGKGTVTAQSGKKLSFRRDDTGTILGFAPQNNIYDIVLSEVNENITVTIDYFLNSNPEFATTDGHKVSVALDKDTDILKGLSINGGKLVIEAESSSGKPVKCIKDNERIAGSKTGTLYKFTISDITDDATVTIGYSKYTATIGFTENSATDKATLKINGEEVEAGGSISVYEGTDVEYSVDADGGYCVYGWYDNDGGKFSDAEPFIISNINSDIAYYAEVKAGARLTVNTISAGTSTIVANGSTIESGRTYYYDPNSEIKLTASPATVCDFVKWCDADGKTLSTGNPYSFTLSSSLTITAVFAPQGALSGVFSVSGNKKVRFSKGNLYYDGTQSKYFFESNQYAVPPLTFNNETENHVGHFYWSKTATVAISLSNYFEPYQPSNKDVFFTNDSENQAKPNLGFTVNGQTGLWRVLSGGADGEWNYLLNSRATTYGTGTAIENRRYAAVKVNDMPGLLIFPDEFSWPTGAGTEPSTFNAAESDWNGVNYKGAAFEALQSAGCVFLPAAGFRNGDPSYQNPADVVGAGSYGYYWSASPNVDYYAFDLDFYSGNVNPSNNALRYQACAVRLVTESK